jgi:hypothetical protein
MGERLSARKGLCSTALTAVVAVAGLAAYGGAAGAAPQPTISQV